MAHIDPTARICGHNALVVRKLLSCCTAPFSVHSAFFAHRLKISQRAGRAFVQELLKEGYIEDIERPPHKWGPSYQATLRGHRLIASTALRPITRKTATRLAKELVVRIGQVPRLTHMVYVVREAWVFGSYLSDTPRLSDVDVFIKLMPRNENRELHIREQDLRVREIGKTRRFANISDRLTSPYYEVMRFLRARNGYYHFTDMTDNDNSELFETTNKLRLYPVSEVDLTD